MSLLLATPAFVFRNISEKPVSSFHLCAYNKGSTVLVRDETYCQAAAIKQEDIRQGGTNSAKEAAALIIYTSAMSNGKQAQFQGGYEVVFDVKRDPNVLIFLAFDV